MTSDISHYQMTNSRWLTVRCLLVAVSLSGCADVRMFREPNTTARIAPGFHLRDDGKGAYARGVDYVDSFFQGHGQYKWVLRPTQEVGGKEVRSFYANMNDPVAGSGAVALGDVRDYRSQVIVFASRPLDRLAIGVPERGDKVTVHFHSRGKYYGMVFEPRPTGTGNTLLTGAGTTASILTRTGDSTWTLELPPGSVGRLWEDPGHDQRVDRGLYHFDLSIAVKVETLR